MDAFFRTHKYLVENLGTPVHRVLMDEIDWNQRLIGIKGTRGVGKTTFLLDYVRTYFGTDRSCLYINLNNFYFSKRTLISFADEFLKTGGKILLLDQVYKYPDWSKELREIYDKMPDLKVIFTGTSVMRLKEENPDLYQRAASYNLRGFSFREFLNYESGNQFSHYSLKEIMENHVAIAQKITSEVRPLAFFGDYLHHGFYPFYLERHAYSENLLKTINLILEIDVSYLQQIEWKYLPKLRKLLFLLAKEAPVRPNVSKLSAEIETSRATVMNYLKYLKNARLFNLLYPQGADKTKKPDQVFMQNTNLLHAISPGNVENSALRETFFYNQMLTDHKVFSGIGKHQFLVDGLYHFKVGGKHLKAESGENCFAAPDMIEVGEGKTIPLWLLGFLY